MNDAEKAAKCKALVATTDVQIIIDQACRTGELTPMGLTQICANQLRYFSLSNVKELLPAINSLDRVIRTLVRSLELGMKVQQIQKEMNKDSQLAELEALVASVLEENKRLHKEIAKLTDETERLKRALRLEQERVVELKRLQESEE